MSSTFTCKCHFKLFEKIVDEYFFFIFDIFNDENSFKFKLVASRVADVKATAVIETRTVRKYFITARVDIQ